MDKDYFCDMFETSTSHSAFTSKLGLTFFLGLPLLRLGSDVSGGGYKLIEQRDKCYHCYSLLLNIQPSCRHSLRHPCNGNKDDSRNPVYNTPSFLGKNYKGDKLQMLSWIDHGMLCLTSITQIVSPGLPSMGLYKHVHCTGWSISLSGSRSVS